MYSFLSLIIPAYSPNNESKVPIDGCEFELAILSIAPSIISAPASIHFTIEYAPVPAAQPSYRSNY